MKKLKQILGGVLGIKANKINDKTSPENVKSWDSFHGLLLVTELESRYGVKFTMEDVLSVRNVGDIKTALKKYKIKLEEE